mgnify:CR=1 FL=1
MAALHRRSSSNKAWRTRAEDGFRTISASPCSPYGKLSKKRLRRAWNDGARVDVDEYEKDNARDLRPVEGSQTRRGYLGDVDRPRPSGRGTSSAPQMSMEELGNRFDTACGRRGPDLSSSRKRNRAIRVTDWKDRSLIYWFHARFLLVEGEKMSKSARQLLHTVRDLVPEGT